MLVSMGTLFKNGSSVFICMLLINLYLPLELVQTSKNPLLKRFNKRTKSKKSGNIDQLPSVLTSVYNTSELKHTAYEYQKRIINTTIKSSNQKLYTNLYVFQITNNASEIQSFIEKEGLVFIRKVFQDGNYYLFRHSSSCGRCRRNAESFLKKIIRHSSVKWASQQISLERVHRSRLEEPFRRDIYRTPLHGSYMDKNFPARETELAFDDPLFEEQWYLLNKGQTGSQPENDINVLPVWQAGITGRGVRISVLDDGIDPESEEVAENYDLITSEDYSYLSSELTPIKENSHGTYCAAIAAGVANNKICGVGVAFHAKVGGVRILDGPVTDAQEAMALVHALDDVDIYTASWGPNDDGKNIAGPGTLVKIAFLKGITQGRNGKGAIYVWAAGNGGRNHDNCNLDGYASSPFTLTIGALTADGLSTYYSEQCAAVIASAYVGGSHLPPAERDMEAERRKIKVVVPEGKGKCRETFQGTSAAAPMAAGAIALLLQANPDLSWRDVQHIIVATSRVPPSGEGGWHVNGAGHPFHLKIGFGVLDAEKMIAAALRWRTVAPLVVWTSPALTSKRLIPSYDVLDIPMLVEIQSLHERIRRLEFVIATVNIFHHRCGDLELSLRSPSGTVSRLLTGRPDDDRNVRIPDWEFVTLHFWGEDPDGLWLLKVSNRGSRFAGVVDLFSLALHGTT